MRVPWNEDMRVKFPATIQFMRLGYEYQSLKDAEIHTETRIFLNRFVPSIQRINSGKVLTEEQILAEVEEIHNIIKNNDMGKEFLARLLDQTADIKLIDFTHPESNDFAIVDELTFGPEAKGSFRPDVTVLVNGIPLGFLEVKKPNNEGGIQKEFHRMLDERLQVPEFKKYFNMLQFVTFSNSLADFIGAGFQCVINGLYNVIIHDYSFPGFMPLTKSISVHPWLYIAQRSLHFLAMIQSMSFVSFVAGLSILANTQAVSW